MSQARALALTAAAALGLSSGCVSLPKGPGFQGVQDAVRERSGLTVQWNQQAPPAPSSEEVVQAFLQKELTAQDAVEVALLNNRRLQATFEELEIKRAELVLAALPRNPIFGGEIRFPGIPTRPLELTLAQSLLDLVQLGMRRKLAAAAFEPAKLRTANEVLNLVAEVRSTFYSLQAAEQVKITRQAIADAARASAELAIRQHEAGNISDLDLENEQALFEQAKLDLAQSESDVLGKRERLNVLLGLWGTQTSWRIAPSLPDLPPAEPSLEHVESRAVSERLDLMAAHQDIAAAARALPLARTEGIKDLDVGVHREREPEGTTTTGPAVLVPVPIFPRGRAAKARAEAALRQSQQRFAALAVEVRAEVREIRNRLLLARDRAEYYRDVILPRRKRIVEFSQQKYNYMLLGAFQLLLARQNEIRAQLDYIETLRDYWIARSDLERAAGGKLEADESSAPSTQPAELQKETPMPNGTGEQHGGGDR